MFECLKRFVISLAFFHVLCGCSNLAESKDKVIVFFGVYTQHYKLHEAFRDCEVLDYDAKTKGVSPFPDVVSLKKSRLVVLSDVSGAEFTDKQIAAITEFVENGGRLLVLGGPMTLGLGEFYKNGIGQILPVKLQAFDLKWRKEGAAIEKNMESPLLTGMDFDKPAFAYWIHKVVPKKGAEVILKCAEFPLLVSGRYGAGTVFVFTGTPMGIPRKKQIPFWKWSGWRRVLENLECGK